MDNPFISTWPYELILSSKITSNSELLRLGDFGHLAVLDMARQSAMPWNADAKNFWSKVSKMSEVPGTIAVYFPIHHSKVIITITKNVQHHKSLTHNHKENQSQFVLPCISFSLGFPKKKRSSILRTPKQTRDEKTPGLRHAALALPVQCPFEYQPLWP